MFIFLKILISIFCEYWTVFLHYESRLGILQYLRSLNFVHLLLDFIRLAAIRRSTKGIGFPFSILNIGVDANVSGLAGSGVNISCVAGSGGGLTL